jgi:hypothetical protein
MRHTTKLLTNKKMNNATFSLRKKAMAFIYEAKALVSTFALPRSLNLLWG